MSACFQENLEYGKRGELVFALALRERQFFVTHLATIQNYGGAPRSFGKYGAAIVLPDLQAHKDGKTFSIEVKRKGAASYTYITGRDEHGIGLRKYRDYCTYQRCSWIPFILAIVEENTGELLARPLASLGDPRCPPDTGKMDKGGMAFWPRKAFRSFAQISPPADLPLFRNIILPPTLPVDDNWMCLGDAANNVAEQLRGKTVRPGRA